jgi:superfamily II helicase
VKNREARPRRCIVCDLPHAEGIEIYGQFICADCEQEMVRTEASELRYQYYVQRLKRIRMLLEEPRSGTAADVRRTLP